MNRDDSEPRYVISIAARILGTQTYTLRYYEKIGIIEPYRSRGNIRLYSERDIELLRRARTLMDDMGVNLAGVEVILHLRRYDVNTAIELVLWIQKKNHSAYLLHRKKIINISETLP